MEIKEQKKELVEEQLCSPHASNNIIDSLGDADYGVDFDAWLDKFVRADVVSRLHDLLNPHSARHVYTADTETWLHIYNHFKANAYTFTSHIRSEIYGLNEMDIKVVMLTVLGFKTCDIALLLDKSSNHITNIRNRVAHKLLDKEISARILRDELLSMMKNMNKMT